MKTLFIAAMCIALAAAVPVQQDVQTKSQYIHAKPDDLLKPLDDIIKEIKLEEQEDAQKVAEDKAKWDHRIKEEAARKKDHEDKEVLMKAAHKALDDQQTLENKREAEYAANNEVRAMELKALKKLRENTDALVKVGPADGTLGTMPASKVIPAAVKSTLMEAATQLIQKSSRPEYNNLVNDLQRKGSDTDQLYKDIEAAEASINAEDKKDAAEVQVEIKKTRDFRGKYDKAEADRVAAKREWEEATQRSTTAKGAHDATVKNKAEADKLRADELKVIEDAKKLVQELLNVRKTQTTTDVQLQTERANASTQKLRELVATLTKDVKTEEATQLKVLNMMIAAEVAARRKMMIARAVWYKQRTETKAAFKRFEKAHGEWEGTEMALAQEQAVAANERKVIGEVRIMLKKLEAASLKTLGNCPTGADGSVCNGAGVCKKEKNGLGAKCVCTGYGKTGFDCSLCKFGFKDVDGACTKVFETAVSFLQTENKGYTRDDLNQMVEDLQEGRTHAKQKRGIEELLRSLEAKLDAQEKLLIEESTKAKDVKEIFEAHWNANKTKEANDKKAFYLSYYQWKAAYKRRQAIQRMYDYEHPLRMKELELLKLLDGIIDKLEGKKVANFTSAPTPAATKSTYSATKAPTTA